jgi:hypothetical protein
VRSVNEPQWCALTGKFCHCTKRCDWYDRVSEYADAMRRCDAELAQEGQPGGDWSTRGSPLKAGS